jgi:hypothetical protein
MLTPMSPTLRYAAIGFCAAAIPVGALVAFILKGLADTFKPGPDELKGGIAECVIATIFAGLIGAAIGALIGIFQPRKTRRPS